MAEPFFSVIIPVFNREKLISKTLNSVLNQTFEDYEVIVVDDGSTDRTLATLADFSDTVTLVTQHNQGPSVARNTGIAKATGKYVAFLDSDDFWFPWTLAVYEKVIAQTQSAFISGTAFDFDQEAALENICSEQVRFKIFPDYLASSEHSIWTLPSATVVEAQLLKQSGGFTQSWINGEDSDLWLKLGIASRFVIINAPFVSAYRRHTGSAISNQEKTIKGSFHLITQEKAGHYPGGEDRKRERWRILTRHIRPVSLSCLHQGNFRQGWQLYISTFLWHLQLMRVRYLAAFLAITTFSALRKRK